MSDPWLQLHAIIRQAIDPNLDDPEAPVWADDAIAAMQEAGLSVTSSEWEANPDKPVLACGKWRNNAEMIADVARLYAKPDDLVVDATFGMGAFWSVFKPERFVAHDLDKAKADGVDWRQLPEADGTVDVLVLDCPYVAKGGRETSTIGQMDNAYGMLTTEKNPALQWAKIVLGIEEAHRVLRDGGTIWFKCMKYITGGKLHHFIRDAYTEFDRIGFDVEDEFVLPGGTGPQPGENRDGTKRRQVHSRNNYSVLIVGRKRPTPAPGLFD